MKYKQGGLWLVGTFVSWFAFTILDQFKPKLIESVLNLKGVSLFLFLDFIFICISAFGVFLLLKEKYGWFRNEEIEHKPNLEEYSKHLKELMCSVKENLVTPKSNSRLFDILDKESQKDQLYPDYFNAIKKSPKRIALLQHLMTDIANPVDERPKLYLYFSLTQKTIQENKKNPNYSHERWIKQSFIPSFNEEFDHVFHSIFDGKPIFGACDGCIEFYSGRNYFKCRNILDNTKSE